MAKKQTRKHSSSKNEVEGNVDKIREILFGGQMRDYEGRFADLEKRLVQRVEGISSEFDKRIERLDGYAKRELEKLAERIKNERSERIANARSGSQELKDATRQIETWFGEVEDRLESDTKELRGALDEQNEELSALIEESREHLNAALISETRDLADGKLAREDLAGLLTEVAQRLKKDFKSPKG